jgi:hypothetical protein
MGWQTTLVDYPGSFFAPPLALLPPAEVAEDGQDQRHDTPDGQVAEGGARSPSEPGDACKEEGEHGDEWEGEREGPTDLLDAHLQRDAVLGLCLLLGGTVPRL